MLSCPQTVTKSHRQAFKSGLGVFHRCHSLHGEFGGSLSSLSSSFSSSHPGERWFLWGNLYHALVPAAWALVCREKESGGKKNRKYLLMVKSHVNAHHFSSFLYGTLAHAWGYRQKVRGHSTLVILLHIQSQFGYLCMLLNPAASLDNASAYIPPFCLGDHHTNSF